jgi:hypothetical protein
VYKPRPICWWVSVTMTSACQWRNGKCVYVSVCVIDIHVCAATWQTAQSTRLMDPYILMKNVYLSILDLCNLKPFCLSKSIWKPFRLFHPLPSSLSHALSASEHTMSVSRCPLGVHKKRSFLQFCLFFVLSQFFLKFLVRDDPNSDDLLLYGSGRCGE